MKITKEKLIHASLGIAPFASLLFLLIKALTTKDEYESLGYGLLMIVCLPFIYAYIEFLYRRDDKHENPE